MLSTCDGASIMLEALQEAYLSQLHLRAEAMSRKLNDNMKKLSAFATIFLPLSLISGSEETQRARDSSRMADGWKSDFSRFLLTFFCFVPLLVCFFFFFFFFFFCLFLLQYYGYERRSAFAGVAASRGWSEYQYTACILDDHFSHDLHRSVQQEKHKHTHTHTRTQADKQAGRRG